MSYNSKTLLWLFVFFPVGLSRMWRWKCSWHPAVKTAVTAPVLLALLAVMLYPEPSVGIAGNVTLYGPSRDAKIYGPDIPMGYTLPSETPAPVSVIVPEEELVDTRLFVYAGDNAVCYHLASCDYAYAGAKKMTVYEAYYEKLKPCDICGSPPYSGGFE